MKKKVTVYFQPGDHEEFKRLCKENDKSMAALLLEMAKQYMKRNR